MKKFDELQEDVVAILEDRDPIYEEEDVLTEATMKTKDIGKMIDTIMDKTAGAKSGDGKEINKMANDMNAQYFDKQQDLSPKQVGWLMKTMKALSGKKGGGDE